MLSIKSDLAEKKGEAEILERLVRDMSDQPGSVALVPILKSAFVLLLYNMMESTMTIVLERIHEAAGKESYCNLRGELRELLIEYFVNASPERSRFANIEQIMSGCFRLPPLRDYLKKRKLFSGNLDGRALNELLVRYGIGALTSPDRDKLLEIKSKRNSIAHGEEMFKEACRNKTLGELSELKTACFNALENIVSQAEVFISRKKYMVGA